MRYDPQSGPGEKWQPGIDAALRSAGSATPPEGLEGRILTRLAAARLADPGTSWFGRWPRYGLPALGFAAAGLVCAVVVVGSVEHSRGIHPGRIPAPPVLALPGQGMGAASAVHPAAPASAPLAAGPNDRGRSTRRLSRARARIAPNARKAHGVAVPAPATTPQQ